MSIFWYVIFNFYSFNSLIFVYLVLWLLSVNDIETKFSKKYPFRYVSRQHGVNTNHKPIHWHVKTPNFVCGRWTKLYNKTDSFWKGTLIILRTPNGSQKDEYTRYCLGAAIANKRLWYGRNDCCYLSSCGIAVATRF